MAKVPSSAEFMAALEHPRKAEINLLRQIILAASQDISEGLKWNAPSFFYKAWFATINLRARDGVQIILHRGAKTREDMKPVDDPHGLLRWLDGNRAIVAFASADDIADRGVEFTGVVQAWIEQM